MKSLFEYSVLTCTLGYILAIVSVILVTIIYMLVSGWHLSFMFFTLTLVTFRIYEIHPIFILAPPLVAIITMILLSKTKINKRITPGLSMISYYIIITLIFLIIGAGEFPYEILIVWIPWLFFIGVVSSIIIDRYLKTRI